MTDRLKPTAHPARAGDRLRVLAAATALALATGCANPAIGEDSGGTPPANAEGTAAGGPTRGPDAVTSRFGAYLASQYAEQVSDYESAAVLLDRVLEESPDDPRLMRRAFLANLGAGRYERAVALAGQIADEQPLDLGLAAMTRAAEAMRAGDYATAHDIADGAERSGITRYAAPLMSAWAEAGRGEVDKALTALAEVNTDGGFGRLADLHAGLIHKMAGNYAEAEKRLAPSEEDGGVAQMPARFVRVLARVRLAAVDAKAAEDLLAAYTEANPDIRIAKRDLAVLRDTGKLDDLIVDPAAGVADGLYHLASGIRRQAETPALAYARLAVYLDPDMDLSRMLIAGVLEDRGRHKEAIAELERIDAESDYIRTARLSMADNLMALKRDAEAAALLERMAAEEPDRIEALMRLGYLMRARERFEEGVGVYERVRERLGDITEEHWLVFYYHGITLERTDRWQQAEDAFLKALELKPGDPYVLNYLGYSWVDKGLNIERAKEMIREAVAQRQNDGYIVDSLGWVHFKLGNFDEAVHHLERAVQLRPQDPIINDHLGDAYWRVGRRLEARFQWDRVLTLDPEEDLAESVADKLESGLTSDTPVTVVD